MTDRPGGGEELRLCGYCETWNSKPCGEQCRLRPQDPTWDQHWEREVARVGALTKATDTETDRG